MRRVNVHQLLRSGDLAISTPFLIVDDDDDDDSSCFVPPRIMDLTSSMTIGEGKPEKKAASRPLVMIISHDDDDDDDDEVVWRIQHAPRAWSQSTNET